MRSSAEVAPITSAFTRHQRQPVSDATCTAPQVNCVQALTCDARADLAERIPTNSLADGTFKYNFVSPSASVLKPTGGHFGEGDGESFTTFFFLTGAFFTGALAVALAFAEAVGFGVGVGLLVAAVVEVRDSERKSAEKTATSLILIALAPT